MSWPSLEVSRALAFREERGGFSLILKRNCSISPAGLACVFIALSAAVLAIGVGFAMAGAWLILPFAGVEVLLLGGAFVLHARHAADYERIELDRQRLRVEVAQADEVARYELDARLARVVLQDGARLVLRAPERELELGRHLDAGSRAKFAAELQKRLRI